LRKTDPFLAQAGLSKALNATATAQEQSALASMGKPKTSTSLTAAKLRATHGLPTKGIALMASVPRAATAQVATRSLNASARSSTAPGVSTGLGAGFGSAPTLASAMPWTAVGSAKLKEEMRKAKPVKVKESEISKVLSEVRALQDDLPGLRPL
jgi:hypothetical protein